MIVIATSDKGGTGRSVTGSNVVYRRALQGSDVCYVDFDFGSPTAGAIFGISALTRGTTTGKGTHSYLLGRSSAEELWDVWQHSDRQSLRQRPPGTGRLALVPGDASGGEFSFDDAVVDRCIDLFLRLHSEFEVVLVDLSAGRSYAAEIVIAATSSPELINVTTRWLVFHRWTRQHILAAHGLVFGERGLLDIGEAHGRDREQVHRRHPLRPHRDRGSQRAGPRWAAAAATRLAPRGQPGTAADGRRARRGPVRHARRGAAGSRPAMARAADHRQRRLGHATSRTRPPIEAFDSIAKKITDESAWEQL